MSLDISVLSYPQIFLYLRKWSRRYAKEREFERDFEIQKLALLGSWITGQEIKPEDIAAPKKRDPVDSTLALEKQLEVLKRQSGLQIEER